MERSFTPDAPEVRNGAGDRPVTTPGAGAVHSHGDAEFPFGRRPGSFEHHTRQGTS